MLLRFGATAMITTQLVMVALMTMTPVHMRDHGHGLGAAGLVIPLHIAAMFLPSPLTGALVDRLGRLGWNLGLVAGTALLTDAVPLQSHARTQGTVDLGVALAGATGGIGSGLVVAATSFAALGLAGGLVALALVPTLLLSRSATRASRPVEAGGSA